MTDVKPIPDNYPVVSPYLAVDGAAAAIDFYSTVFGASLRGRLDGPGGTIAHAEMDFGRGSMVMLSDPFPGAQQTTPGELGGSPVSVMIYVDDVDTVFDHAIKLGAKELQPVETQFYGDRSGQFEDPWGHRWYVASHVEDVSEEEMAKRASEFMGGDQ